MLIWVFLVLTISLLLILWLLIYYYVADIGVSRRIILVMAIIQRSADCDVYLGGIGLGDALPSWRGHAVKVDVA